MASLNKSLVAIYCTAGLRPVEMHTNVCVKQKQTATIQFVSNIDPIFQIRKEGGVAVEYEYLQVGSHFFFFFVSVK